MASLSKKQNTASLFRKADVLRSSSALSSLALLVPAVLGTSVSLTQPAWADCTKTGSNVVCEGTSSAIDAAVENIGSGETLTNNGDASAVGHLLWVFGGRGEGMTLVNNGSIKTELVVNGIDVFGDRNTVVNNGGILTSWDFARGIHVVGIANSALNTGTIDMADGKQTHGMHAYGVRNQVTNEGEILTRGENAAGIILVGYHNTALNAGTITSSGAHASGITVEAKGYKTYEGVGNSVVNRGTITVSGEAASGIWVPSKAGQEATIVNEKTGTIISQKGRALQFGAGNERVENFGRLGTSTTGAAADLGEGNDAFLIGSTSRIEGFVEANVGQDTFALGGSDDGAFDASQIGSTAKYRNFESYEKVGSSTWTIFASNDSAMPWAVKEGGLMVTGSMGGSVMTVHSGALLGGTGTIGGIDARTGSTLSPGLNGIGSLAVTGNVLVADGITYKIDLGADLRSDQIVADGKATVQGGLVQVNALPGDYKPGSRWTILTANGGVTGQFSQVFTNLAFFRPVLSKDGKHIYLNLARIDDPLPGNEPAPGGEPTPGGEPSPDPETSPIAFDVSTVLVHDDLFRAAVLCRLRCSTGGLPSFAASDIVTADYAADMPVSKGTAAPIAVPMPQTNRDWALWAKGIGSWGSTEATSTSLAVQRSTAGLVFGADTGFGTPYRLGIAGGYFSTNLDFASAYASGNVESLHLGVYGSAAFGALNLRGGLAYAHHEIDTSFTPSYASNRFSSSLDSFQAFGELGYAIPLSQQVMIEPFVGLAHVHVASSGVRVEGSDIVSGQVHSFDTTYSTLGARLVATMPTEAGLVTFKGLLGWRHAFGDIVPKATFSFVGDNRPLFLTGTPIDKDSLVVEAGLNWEVSKSTTLSVSYTGTMGRRDQEHTIRGGLTIRF